ncbi:g6544 [Coccomyxa elongata]
MVPSCNRREKQEGSQRISTPPALAASAVNQDEPAIKHSDVQGHLQHDTASSGGLLKPLDAINNTGGADSRSPDVPLPAEVQPVPASDDTAVPQTPSTPESTAQVSELEEEEDRHNFALAKDGAKVVAANKEARKPESLLDSDGDTFLKNECKADKWVLVELSQVTKVDMIKLSQYELYSSRVRDFEVYGRQSHPRTDGSDYSRHLHSSSWQLIGKFTAGNVKGTQAFHAEQPIWAKYLQLRLLTHYGSEPVCALNDVRVYGKSAVEDLEDRLALEAASDTDEEQQEVGQELQQQEAAGADIHPAPQLQPQSEPVPAGKEDAVANQRSGILDNGEGAAEELSPISNAAANPKAPEVLGHSVESQAVAEMPAGVVGQGKSAAVGETVKADHAVLPLSEAETLPGSVDKGEGTAPVLEVLSAGLRRLIAPPGTGKKRATFQGPATSMDSMPLPAAPLGSPGALTGSVIKAEPQGQGLEQQQVGAAETGKAEVVPEPAADSREMVGLLPIVVDMQGAQASSDANGTAVDAMPGTPTGSEGVAGTGEGRGRNGQAAEKEKELLLAGNSAGSSKARNGGSVYDILVAEIKALKLQQKMVPRALSDMQKNVSSAITALAAELSSFHRRLSDLEASSEASSMCIVGDSEEAGASSQLHDTSQPAGNVQYKLDIQAIAVELAALRSAAERANRREFAMVMVITMLCALLVLCLPRIGSQHPIFRGAVFLLALANGCVGLLLHYANALPALEKGSFANAQGFVGI